jgi:hypothetical protein
MGWIQTISIQISAVLPQKVALFLFFFLHFTCRMLIFFRLAANGVEFRSKMAERRCHFCLEFWTPNDGKYFEASVILQFIFSWISVLISWGSHLIRAAFPVWPISVCTGEPSVNLTCRVRVTKAEGERDRNLRISVISTWILFPSHKWSIFLIACPRVAALPQGVVGDLDVIYRLIWAIKGASWCFWNGLIYTSGNSQRFRAHLKTYSHLFCSSGPFHFVWSSA